MPDDVQLDTNSQKTASESTGNWWKKFKQGFQEQTGRDPVSMVSDGLFGATPLGTALFGVKAVADKTGIKIPGISDPGPVRLRTESRAEIDARIAAEKDKAARDAQKIAMGAPLGPVPKQDGRNIPVEDRQGTSVSRVSQPATVSGNDLAGVGVEESTFPAVVDTSVVVGATASQSIITARSLTTSIAPAVPAAVTLVASTAPAAAAAPAPTKQPSIAEKLAQEVRGFEDKMKPHMTGKSEKSILARAFEEVKRDYELRELRARKPGSGIEFTNEDGEKLKLLQGMSQDKNQFTAVLSAVPAGP